MELLTFFEILRQHLHLCQQKEKQGNREMIARNKKKMTLLIPNSKKKLQLGTHIQIQMLVVIHSRHFSLEELNMKHPRTNFNVKWKHMAQFGGFIWFTILSQESHVVMHLLNLNMNEICTVLINMLMVRRLMDVA